MKTILLCLLVTFCAVNAVAQTSKPDFDLVLAGGRVMNPETGLDGVRDIGIKAGRIAAISMQPLEGRKIIDVHGLVVAPGFIDVHAHGQDLKSAQLQAQDGVTTALETELGSLAVSPWYAAREGKSPINYGVGAGHRQARVSVMSNVDAPDPLFAANPLLVEQREEWKRDAATPAQLDQIVAAIGREVDEGALDIGMIIQHTPGARREEIYRVFQLAAQKKVPVFAHIRNMSEKEPESSLDAVQEVLADAAATGASLHIMHIASSCLGQTPVCLQIIAGARDRGTDVTTEAYPYTAASTAITAATFDDGWQQRLGISYGSLQWSATGERLTEETFAKYRAQGGLVIMHMIPEDIAELAIRDPRALISSDGLPFRTGGEHPRGAGSFARVLGRYVRDRKVLTLMQALKKFTLMPAQRLEPFVPMMAWKGRIKLGADADLTVFDAQRVLDRATFESPMQPSAGIVHVFVGGVAVVSDSALVADARPGRAVRRAAVR
jgi:N-acyl-D-aspartate/D-glutamate deacylase